MSKIKTAYFCNSCGHESAKWLGKCPSCNTWNTFVEEVISKDSDKKETGWKILDEQLPEWISNNESILNDMIEQNLINP